MSDKSAGVGGVAGRDELDGLVVRAQGSGNAIPVAPETLGVIAVAPDGGRVVRRTLDDGADVDYVVIDVPDDGSAALHAFCLGFYTQKLPGLLSAVPAGEMTAGDVRRDALELFRAEVLDYDPGASCDDVTRFAFDVAAGTARRVIANAWRAQLAAHRAWLQQDVQAIVFAVIGSVGGDDRVVDPDRLHRLGVEPFGAFADAIRAYVARGPQDALDPAHVPGAAVDAYVDEFATNLQLCASTSALATIAAHTATRVDRHRFGFDDEHVESYTHVAGERGRVDLYDHDAGAHVELMLGPFPRGWLKLPALSVDDFDDAPETLAPVELAPVERAPARDARHGSCGERA